MSRFRYLTFDCYGTLVDWRTGIEKSLKKLFGRIPLGGKELLDAYVDAEKREEETYKTYREVLKNSAVRLSKTVGFDASLREAAAFAESVPAWPAFPDTRATLQKLGKEGYKRYILSNVDTDLLSATVRRNGFEVDGFVTAEEVGSYKPDKGHWLKFMEKTGARTSEVLHVAQSIFHDIIPAQEMGIASAWVNRYDEPLARGAQPVYIADSLESLAELLG